MANNKIKVGITHGDTNGIGYEVILKAMEDPRITELCTPVIYGSAKAAAYYRKGIDMQPVSLVQIADASQAREDQINIINVVGEDLAIEPGVSSKAAGEAAFKALERARSMSSSRPLSTKTLSKARHSTSRDTRSILNRRSAKATTRA